LINCPTAAGAWRARHIGFVFQLYNLMPVLTAERNVELPLLLTHLSKAERKKKHVETALAVVGLSHRAKHYPRTLSGGEQQRVGIARGIVTDPTLLLCDEPTGDLDRKAGDEILDLLQALNREHGKTIIMVTHDPHASARAARTVYLNKGQLEQRAGEMKFLHLIWSNLKRKKLRTSLTLLSIVVAFMLFGFLSAIQQALVGGVALAGADRLIVRHKVSIINLLPVSYKARMDRIPGVDFATHQTWFGGIYQDPKNFFMQNPVVPEEFLKMHPGNHPAAGTVEGLAGHADGRDRRPPDGEPFPLENRRQGAHPIHHLAGRTAAARGSLTSWASTTGRTRAPTPRRCFSATIISTKRGRYGKGQVGWYTIRIKDPSQAAEVAKRVDAGI
jgi:ABC-type nitrate/sulfonate/bicarbonate transport system ATPase subunit